MANLKPGIYPNAKLVKIEFTAKDTWKAIDLLFAHEDSFYRHRIFEPKEERRERVREHINYILSFFMTREEIKKIVGKSFEEFATKLAQVYKTNKLYEKAVHLKIFQLKNGYAGIPDLFTYGFLQDGDIPCSLEFTDWEIENNMAPTETATTIPAKEEDDTDDLPF